MHSMCVYGMDLEEIFNDVCMYVCMYVCVCYPDVLSSLFYIDFVYVYVYMCVLTVKILTTFGRWVLATFKNIDTQASWLLVTSFMSLQ